MDPKSNILKQFFGYDEFREGQSVLIDSILSGRDCLGVMPTGAGKSLCFQVPALMLEGISLVISPLISLMKDQVRALTQAGIKAAYINSSLSERQIGLALENAKKGVYKIIYIAPERLVTEDFLDFAKHSVISMLTVDEAHCISQWGQDFRPSYLKITEFIKSLPNRPRVSAFTATATSDVREDIVNLLNLQNPTVLVTGFDRDNLSFTVKKPNDKFDELIAFLSANNDKSGIIYCATRKTVEEVSDKLKDLGYSVSRYHAGLSDRERGSNQEDFLYDRVNIMVATNAFGMGIDKSNVGFVVHYNMPKNIESYYQEAGRAGRDGGRAECILLYSPQDVRTNMYLIDTDNGTQYPDAQTEKAVKERDRKRLKEMTFYCHTSDCLRRYILKYFGEDAENYCGNCSNCLSNFLTEDVTVEAKKILSCVIKSGEKYGVTTIIDVLRGSKNEKIRRFALDELSTYNISNLSEKRLRDIINHLVLKGYLFITDGKYPLLQRGDKYNEVLRSDSLIEMKLIKEDVKKEIKADRSAKLKPATPINKELFEKLKQLRLEIANKQEVPAFVIFADSSLTDMCIKLPSNEEEMLQVSGVGQVKLARYGAIFLECIAEFIKDKANSGNTGEGLQDEEEADDSLDFSKIEISSEAVTITAIADRINCLLIQKGYTKVTGAKLNEMLMQKGYLKSQEVQGGAKFKIPTKQGEECGIISEERIIRGANCMVNYFDENAQRLVVGEVSCGLINGS